MLKSIRIFLSILLMPGLIYSGLVILGGLLPINTFFQNNGNIRVYLVQNNSHTDLVLPVSNHVFDWNRIIKPEHFPNTDHHSQYLAFGWGDREFYRSTPYWEDLSLGIALRAVLLNTESAIHVTKRDLSSSKKQIELKLSDEQYSRLSEYILKHLKFEEGQLTPLNFNYSDDDVFYASRSNFHAFRTCNTWINSGLKFSGIKSCLWTPFSFFIFWQNT